MKIPVTCPSCLTRFEVDEKFAGKKGPCPKCKAVIQVPDKKSSVVIHSPELDGPKDSKGRLVLKPIAREETRVTRTGIAIAVVLVALVIAGAVALRFNGSTPLAVQWLALLVLAPPLVWSGYSFTRDQELAPYQGRELWLRVGIVSIVFVATWLIYAFLPGYLFDFDDANQTPYWLFAVSLAAMIGIGTFAAVATFELETLNGFALAALYYVSVFLLALLAGITLAGAQV
jgi:cation transport ATPase